MARYWIRDVGPPNPNSLKEGMITKSNRHTRALDIGQKLVIIRTIRRQKIHFHRIGELVIFNGSLSFDEQVELF